MKEDYLEWLCKSHRRFNMSTFKFVVSRWVINTNYDNWKGLRMTKDVRRINIGNILVVVCNKGEITVEFKKKQRGMTYETSLKEEEINLLKEKGQNR